MGSRNLLVDPSRCTGCRTCEMACSQYHEGKCSPILSRTRVIKFEAEGCNIPTVCNHCSKPDCLSACRRGAMKMDEKTRAVVVDETLCSGCRLCVAACPFSQVSIHPEKRVALKCDLCGGEPQCARFCPTGAIMFSDLDEELMKRRRVMANR